MRVTYNPLVFEQPTPQAARAIILTPEDGLTTDERWERETPYVAQLAGEKLALKPGNLVLDYGCGIGRIAKVLIERFQVHVLGVDISQNMRSLAPTYVGSLNFSIVSPEALRTMIGKGLRADAAIAIWVLQHCVRPHEDIRLIKESMREGARLLVLNNHHRAVPTLEAGWVNDGLDVQSIAAESLTTQATGMPELESIGPRLGIQTYWSLLSK
jgi:SAM-dependent methyltransferase